MEPEHLKTKREYDVYIQSLKDLKQLLNYDMDAKIEYFENCKLFCDEE